MNEKQIRKELGEIAQSIGREDVHKALKHHWNEPNIPLAVVLAYVAILEQRL